MTHRHTDAELSELLPHLFYEIRMLLMADLLLLQERQSPRDPNKIDEWAVHNALVEAHTIHARALFAFFFLDATRPDDAVAADYVVGWPSLRPQPSPILRTVSPRVGKEIAHLTYGRLAYKDDEARQWSFTDITKELIDVINVWLDVAPTQIRGPLLNYLADYSKQADALQAAK